MNKTWVDFLEKSHIILKEMKISMKKLGLPGIFHHN